MPRHSSEEADVIAITDLSDQYESELRYPDPHFKDFGGRSQFFGPIRTLAVFEDNSLVRQAVEGPGKGHVLVISGGGSMRCALVGGNLAALAEKNGWAGIVVDGCVRDGEELAAVQIGIRARATHPRRSEKRGTGIFDTSLRFAGVTIDPGDWLYADRDGMVVASRALS